LSRFTLSPDAEYDLAEILDYLNGLPHKPVDRIGSSIENMLHSIGKQPYLGAPHSALTRLIGEEVRSRLVHPYRIFYRLGKNIPEFFALRHGARDPAALLDRRFQ
jgi:plasmid stabilization system protein ParE